jgi:septal ring factor EnvC (AmiA/AmiB activator)
MSQTKKFIDAEIIRLHTLIEKNRREVSDKEKMILGQNQEIGKLQELVRELQADLEKLSA